MSSLNAQWLRQEAKQMRHDGKAHWAVHIMASLMEQAADEIDRLRTALAAAEDGLNYSKAFEVACENGFKAGIEAAAQIVNERRWDARDKDIRCIVADIRALRPPAAPVWSQTMTSGNSPACTTVIEPVSAPAGAQPSGVMTGKQVWEGFPGARPSEDGVARAIFDVIRVSWGDAFKAAKTVLALLQEPKK